MIKRLKQLKTILKKPSLRFQVINILKYFKRLIINRRFINFFYNTKKNNNFYESWKAGLERDLESKQNWRRGRKEFEEDMIDFARIEKIFKLLSKTNKTILEIGSYDGYFIKHYSCFENIILADINKKSNLYPKDNKFKFYHLNGFDLNNIPSNSADVVFSIDTLVRIERKILKNYISDLSRIVKKNGYLILHIPNIFHYNSLVMNYINTTPFFYKRILRRYSNRIIFDNQLHQMSSILICQINK